MSTTEACEIETVTTWGRARTVCACVAHTARTRPEALPSAELGDDTADSEYQSSPSKAWYMVRAVAAGRRRVDEWLYEPWTILGELRVRGLDRVTRQPVRAVIDMSRVVADYRSLHQD